MEFINKNKYLILILAISLLPFVYLFSSSDLVHTHDGLVHLPRIAAFFQALSDGNFPVRWAGNLNYGYGLPLFIFIYHVPYLVGSLFLLFGFSLVSAFKLSLLVSFLLSGVSMYLFAKEIFRDSQKAFLVAVAYQFAPFHLVEVLNRGSFGSIYAYAFLPLVLYFLYKLIKKYTLTNFIFTSISVFLLIWSHNSLSLLFFGVSIFFVLFFAKGISALRPLVALGMGLVIAAFYWMPAVLEHKYTFGDLFMKDVYADHFAPLSYFFGFNIFNNQNFFFEGVNLNIGIFHILALIITIALLVTRKINEDRKIIYFSLSIFVIAFFFMIEASGFIWKSDAASYLRQFQFPWRFMALIVFSTSIMLVNFLKYPKFNRLYSYLGLIFFIVVYTFFMWKPVEGYDKIDQDYYWNFPLNTTYYGETDIIWSSGPAHDYPKSRVEIIGGQGEVDNIIVKNNQHEYDVSSESNLQVVSHVQYFPGWRVYVDGNHVPVEFQDPNNRGEVTYSIPSGHHKVLVRFEESRVRFFSNILSLVSLFVLIPIYYVFKKIIKK